MTLLTKSADDVSPLKPIIWNLFLWYLLGIFCVNASNFGPCNRCKSCAKNNLAAMQDCGPDKGKNSVLQWKAQACCILISDTDRLRICPVIIFIPSISKTVSLWDRDQGLAMCILAKNHLYCKGVSQGKVGHSCVLYKHTVINCCKLLTVRYAWFVQSCESNHFIIWSHIWLCQNPANLFWCPRPHCSVNDRNLEDCPLVSRKQ